MFICQPTLRGSFHVKKPQKNKNLNSLHFKTGLPISTPYCELLEARTVSLGALAVGKWQTPCCWLNDGMKMTLFSLAHTFPTRNSSHQELTVSAALEFIYIALLRRGKQILWPQSYSLRKGCTITMKFNS